jgi:hypothetical protein
MSSDSAEISARVAHANRRADGVEDGGPTTETRASAAHVSAPQQGANKVTDAGIANASDGADVRAAPTPRARGTLGIWAELTKVRLNALVLVTTAVGYALAEVGRGPVRVPHWRPRARHFSTNSSNVVAMRSCCERADARFPQRRLALQPSSPLACLRATRARRSLH